MLPRVPCKISVKNRMTFLTKFRMTGACNVQKDVEQQVWSTIRRHGMLAEGDCVIVALSGGADSVALFHLLAWGRQTLGLRLLAAHLNHGLRGAAAEEDEAFVRALCEQNGVPLFVRQAEGSPRLAGEGEEAWGRRLRYAFFEELAHSHAAKVATGHSGSDNAETVLFHAIRGSFTAGLSGIPPVRGVFVRPLLDVNREEIRAFCRERGYAYREDASNGDPAYSRNLLRLSALPLLEQAHPGAERALCRLAADMRGLHGWLGAQAEELLRAARAEEVAPGWRLPGYMAARLLAAPQPVRLAALARLAGPRAGRSALAGLEAVLEGRCSALALPGGCTAFLRGGRFLLARQSWPEAPREMVLAEGEYALPGGYRLHVWVEETGCGEKTCEKKQKKGYTFRADYDKIKQCGILRTRSRGDDFAPPGRGLHKPLKKWMIEEGIDRELRALLPLVAERGSGRVLWVWGAGFCAGLQPDADTRRLLCIQTVYAPEENRGGQDGQPEYF